MTIAMETAAFYRAKAIELTVIADELTNSGRQVEWRTMAEIWSELAARVEREDRFLANYDDPRIRRA